MTFSCADLCARHLHVIKKYLNRFYGNIPGLRLKVQSSPPIADIIHWRCFDVLMGVMDLSLV